MSATVSPASDEVYAALRTFILGVIGNGVEVVKGLGNRVPMPQNPFIAITALFRTRLATNVDTWDPSDPNATALSYQESMRLDIQIDCYGPQSGDWASMLSILFRDDYACQVLAPSCQPLHADEPQQMALIDGEQQYEERWSITAAVQYNPVVTRPQQFADVVQVTMVDVDASFPP